MKFQKTAIAAIVAGFAAAPMMASADTVLSGVVQVKFQGDDTDEVVDDPLTLDVDETAPGGDVNIAAGDVRVAIATEHELNSGLIGYGNLQLNLDDLTGEGGVEGAGIQADVADPEGTLTDEDIVELASSATVSSDNVYVGVKGGFGDIRFGEIPLAVEYGQLANDIDDVGTTVPGGLSYTGVFGPVGFGLNFSPEADSDMIGAGINFNFAGATIGAGFEDRAEQTNFAVGVSYAIAGVSLAAHYWTQGQLDFETDDEAGTTTFTSDLDDITNIAVQAGYAIAGVSIGVTYSLLTTAVGEDGTENTAEDEKTAIRLDLGYDLGGGMDISTRINSTSTDAAFGADPDDVVDYRVMLSKTF